MPAKLDYQRGDWIEVDCAEPAHTGRAAHIQKGMFITSMPRRLECAGTAGPQAYYVKQQDAIDVLVQRLRAVRESLAPKQRTP